MEVTKITGREVLDSRGNPMVEVEVWLEENIKGCVAVPSGANAGEKETVELRNRDPKRYNGRGVLQAVENMKQVMAAPLEGKVLHTWRFGKTGYGNIPFFW